MPGTDKVQEAVRLMQEATAMVERRPVQPSSSADGKACRNTERQPVRCAIEDCGCEEAGRDQVLENPSDYNLCTGDEIDEAYQEGERDGQAAVTTNPGDYDLMPIPDGSAGFFHDVAENVLRRLDLADVNFGEVDCCNLAVALQEEFKAEANER